MGLLKTILIILLVYMGFKTVARIFAPVLLKFVTKRAEEQFRGSFNTNHQAQPRTKVGETTVDKVPQPSKTSNKDVGEYIDFEEIE